MARERTELDTHASTLSGLIRYWDGLDRIIMRQLKRDLVAAISYRYLLFFLQMVTPLLLSGTLGTSSNLDCSVDFNWYQVIGSNRSQIAQGILNQGPVDHDGVIRYADTKWWVKWSWPEDKDIRTNLLNTKVDCTVLINLPMWIDAAHESGLETRRRWGAFLRLITEHELGHLSFVQAAVSRIKTRIASGAQSTVGFSVENANGIAISQLRKVQKADRRFDRVTDHGKVQGITLKLLSN